MSTSIYPQSGGDPGDGPRLSLNVGRLWAGGAATTVIAALVVVVGTLVAHGVFGVSVPVPTATGGMSEVTYVLIAAAAALLATLLLYLLLLGAPRPLAFFTWIVVLATIVAMLAPFSSSILGNAAREPLLNSRISVAVINLVVGVAIGSLLTGVARSSITRIPPPRSYQQVPPARPGSGYTTPYPPDPRGPDYPRGQEYPQGPVYPNR